MRSYKPFSSKLYIESAIENYNRQLDEAAKASQADEDIARSKQLKEAENYFSIREKQHNIMNRYNTFTESLSHALLGECVYHVFAKSIRQELLEQENITGMMRAMVSEFIKEDSADILYAMRTKTATLSEMYNLIQSTKKKILESSMFDKNDPTTYRIDQEVKDEFFERLDYMDTESICSAIRDRVANAVDDFMESNKRDHDRIIGAIELTKEKLEEKKDEPEEVKESYQAISKQYIGKVRNRKKGVFESMVMAMSESVMKDDQLREEFAEGAKLNIPKIVDRIETMYTFIECVNTMKLYPVDEAYMQEVIEGLRK